MANSTRYASAGFSYAFFGRRDATGFMTGLSGTAPTAGSTTGEGARRIIGASDVPSIVAESAPQDVLADDGVIAQFLFGSDTLPNFVGSFSANDLELAGAIAGTTVTNIANLKLLSIDPKALNTIDGFLLLSGQAKSKDAGTDGASRYETLLLPLVQPRYLGREAFGYRANANYRYQFSAQYADKSPLGITIQDSTFGSGATTAIAMSGQYPVTMHRFTGDGAETAFVLDYTPIDAQSCYVVVDTAVQTPTTNYTVSGKTITFNVAPASGAKIIVMYEFTE